MAEDVLNEFNGMIIAYNTQDDSGPGDGSHPDMAETDTSQDNGTLILDATCVPPNISFPQDVKIRRAVRRQLQYIRRDRKYIDGLLDAECVLTAKQAGLL